MNFIVEYFWYALEALGLLSTKNARVIFVGLDNAGKTTLLCMLKTGNITAARPTMHPSSEQLTVGSLHIDAYDLGGHQSARRLWKDYCSDLDGIIFLCDAADPERFKEAHDELTRLMASLDNETTPLLVLGNKIDCPGAATGEQLWHELGLEHLGHQRRPFNLFMCSVTQRSGYKEGFDWLASQL